MDVGSSSSDTALAAVPQTKAKLSGPPYRKRARNAMLNDPTLEQVMGTKEKALDVEEFPEASPLNLDGEDQAHWVKVRKILFDDKLVDKATENSNPRSLLSNLSHARQTLRMLQDVSAGTRAKFGICGCAPRQASKNKITKPETNGIAKAKRTKSTTARDNWPAHHHTNMTIASLSAAAQEDATDARDATTKITKPKTNRIAKAKRTKSTTARDNWPNHHHTNMTIASLSAAAQEDATDAKDATTKITKPKTNGIAKAKRTKSTKARDDQPNQHPTSMVIASSSAAAQENATDAMDDTPGDAVLDLIEHGEFETPEQRAANDEAMSQIAIQIREEHPALREITPDTMTCIAHLVHLGVWQRS